MQSAVNAITLPLLGVALLVFLIAGLLWLFLDHGTDKLKNPEEWRNAGSSGEQIIYNTLRNKLHVPDNQILRNVYIPTGNGKTSEIDLLVVSRKGLLVFECKNYAGNIYGDMKRKKWVQYLGKQKNYFYNPFLQNATHVRHLGKYLTKYGDVPIIPFVTTISRGRWKVRNLGNNDYFLGYNCHLKDILAKRAESELIVGHFNEIIQELKPLSRPDEDVRNRHIEQVTKSKVK